MSVSYRKDLNHNSENRLLYYKSYISKTVSSLRNKYKLIVERNRQDKRKTCFDFNRLSIDSCEEASFNGSRTKFLILSHNEGSLEENLEDKRKTSFNLNKYAIDLYDEVSENLNNGRRLTRVVTEFNQNTEYLIAPLNNAHKQSTKSKIPIFQKQNPNTIKREYEINNKVPNLPLKLIDRPPFHFRNLKTFAKVTMVKAPSKVYRS